MKNIPEIRIKGFEGEWKSCTFDEEIERISIMSNDKHLPKVEYEDINSGKGTLNKDVRRKKSNKVGLLFQPDDILFGKLRPYLKNILKASFEGIAVGDFWIYRPKGDSNFLYYLMQTNQYSEATSQTTGTKMPRADWNVVSKSEFNFPNLSEQQSLGSFFSSFDRLLSDHHRRLENLRRVKKSMLQKMFPQQGQTVPEIRFKGFSGEWKEMKLGDVGTIISGVGFPNKEQGGKHGIPFYKVSDMNNKGNETMMINANNYVTKQQIEKYHWKVCEDVPAIFFAKVGAAIFFDRKRLVTTPCLFDNNTMVYCLDKEFWDATFCLKLFEHIKLSSLSQVGSLPSFNGTAVENISVLIPSKAEQHLIGSFLTSLDNLINDEVNYIDQLTRVKSTLLQKMFV